MTHEYVIATGGHVHGVAAERSPEPTAIAWAADRVLAVGSDADVRSISRGDSTFLALDGAAVTALDPAMTLEPGSPADLAFWRDGPDPVAVLRAGHFTEGDAHTGPFPRG